MDDAPTITKSAHGDWESWRLNNGLIKLEIVPQIGGRILQFALGDAELLWVNLQLAGKPPPAGVAQDEWLNYGGDKIWPAPQGWDHDQQWPGPPDPILDGGPYTLDHAANTADEAAVGLSSGKDPRSGIQFARSIRIFRGSTRVGMEITMKNIDTKPRRWGIWAVTQLNAAKPDGTGHNDQFKIYCPLNPQSHFPQGYEVLYGAADNPTFTTDRSRRMLQLRYQYQVGKIALDSSAGWLAAVNGVTGNVFVERFLFEADKEYPDGASVEFWSSGLGRMHTHGRDVVMKDDPIATPFLAETEVLSPFARLQPGESYTYRYDWCATNIGGNHPVSDCRPAGVTVEPLSVMPSPSDWRVTGRFGVFIQGTLQLEWQDRKGTRLGQYDLQRRVTPLHPVVLDEMITAPPTDTARAVLFVGIDARKERNELAATEFIKS
jgi:hypothetical protein